MRKNLIVVVLSLLLLFSSSVMTNASDATNEGLQKSIEFRSIFGLEQSEETIKRINTENNNHESLDQYGVALTDAEYIELKLREAVANEAREMKKNVINKKYSSIFSDLYIDHKNGGVIKIGIVDLPNNLDKSEDIRNEFVNKDRVEFFNTNVSIGELIEIQSRVNDIAKKESSTPVEYTEISVQDNKVVVGLSSNDEKWIYKLNSLSPHIEFVISPVIEQDDARTDLTRPLVGGLSIGTCTGAFAAKKWGTTDTYYYLTAGHCGEIGSSWSQGGSSIGTIQLRNYGGNSDMAGIQISSSNASYKLYDTCDSCVPVRNKEIARVQVDTSDDMVGDSVCMSGKSSGWRCGTIASTTYSPTNWAGTGVDFTNLRRATYYTQGGDSGAPIVGPGDSSFYIYEHEALGINKGHVTISGTTYGVYSHIGYVYSTLGVNQVITNY